MAIIGLDIGGTKILGAVFNKKGKILDKEKQPSNAERGFDAFMQQVHRVIDALKQRSQKNISGIGIGFPGTIDKTGYVIFAPNLPVEEFDLAGHLEAIYQIPVVVGNDVNLGTYGEYCELGIKDANVIGLFPGTGLGGGIVIDGKLYLGQGSAGELGHIVVQKNGVLCSCGNKGCLESYASKQGIMAYIRDQMKLGRTSILRDDVLAGMIKSSMIKNAYEAKDELVLEAMARFTEYLGMGIGIIMNIFHPDLILIGGGIAETFGDVFLEGIKKHSKEYAMPGIYTNTKIQLSRLEDDAVIYGGYHIIKSKLKESKKEV